MAKLRSNNWQPKTNNLTDWLAAASVNILRTQHCSHGVASRNSCSFMVGPGTLWTPLVPAGAQLVFLKDGSCSVKLPLRGSRCQEVLKSYVKILLKGVPGTRYPPPPPPSLSSCATAYELTLPCDWRPLSANDLEIAFKFDDNGVRICPLF